MSENVSIVYPCHVCKSSAIKMKGYRPTEVFLQCQKCNYRTAPMSEEFLFRHWNEEYVQEHGVPEIENHVSHISQEVSQDSSPELTLPCPQCGLIPTHYTNLLACDNSDCFNTIRVYASSYENRIELWNTRVKEGSFFNKQGEIKTDLINHPPHYTSRDINCPECSRHIECIDIVRHFNFELGNVIKYVWRAENKNGIEDLKKAAWYLNNFIKNLEAQEND